MIINMNSSNSGPSEKERFSITTCQLAEAIHYNVSILYEKGYKTIDPNLVLIVSEVIKQFDKDYLIKGFIENSHKSCWDNIKSKKEDFFVENANDIFKYLPAGEVNLFKDLFLTKDDDGNSVIDQQLKDQIWKLFEVMIKISIKYIHKNRSPFAITDKNGELFHKYETDFFNEIDLVKHAATWDIKLEFNLRY